jgi:erythromycin esterase-like protein
MSRDGDVLRSALQPLDGGARDYDALLDFIGDARVVLLGEASHGTLEFYRERARITRRLIEERGFTFVAVEADWPDAYRVNRWVRGQGGDSTAIEALDGFQRFPRWMWRNRTVLEFVEWLRERNDAQSPPQRAGFYGLDLYSLYASIESVLEFLDRVDPEAARRARQRYACFDHFGEDTQAYGYAAEFGLTPSCETDAIAQLVELQRPTAEPGRLGGKVSADELFFAEQNARLVKNAEKYYRTMFRGREESWNVRDRHMAETLEALLEHFDRPGGHARAAVWAHNSHLGDARATSMGDHGELNLGQLARERFDPSETVSVGFTTHAGTVTAADNWGEPAELMRLRPSLPGSVERVFHDLDVPDFYLPLRGSRSAQVLAGRKLERAIGVIYRPRTERVSHYFAADLPSQFDAVIHVDRTRAVEPLDLTPGWVETKEAPETYPSGV